MSLLLDKGNGITIDLVIKDWQAMKALLRVVSLKIYKGLEHDGKHMMTLFTYLRFKLKISYECYVQYSSMKELFLAAINKTVQERQAVARSDL